MGCVCLALALKGSEILFCLQSQQIACDASHPAFDVYSITKVFSSSTTFVETNSGLEKIFAF